MNKLLLICLISFSLLACDKHNSEQPRAVTTIKELSTKQQVSESTKQYILEFDQIMQGLQTTEDVNITDKKLESLLEKIPYTNSSLEEMKLKLKILIRLGYLEQAYELTKEILLVDSNSNLQESQCILLRKMQKSEKEVHDCYEKSANSYLTDMDKFEKSNLKYQYALWGNYSSMYQAGHQEYKDKLKHIVNSQNTDENKDIYEQMYNNVIDPKIMQEVLEAMPYRH